jgi:hypothetical protein
VAFARLVPVPFVALTGLAVYALACELRAPRATAAVFAAAAVMVPALYAYAFEGLPDAIMLFAFVTGMLFLLRHARTGLPSDLVIAGLGLGVAFGTKWYGVTSVVAVLVVWAAVALLARRPPPRVIREGAALLAMIAAAGGIWLVRNLVESGNPIYPQRVDAFGVTLLPGPDGLILDRVGYTVAGYLDDWEVLGDVILPGFARQLGLMGALCLVGVVAAVVLAARGARRRPRDPLDVATLALAAVVVLICALYAITPGSAFGEEGEPVQAFTTVRWLVPAPLLAAALAAAAAARLGRARIVFELAALAAVADGIRRGVGVPLGSALPVAFALALLAGAGWAVYRHRERLAEPIRRRRLALGVAVAAAVTVAAVAAGRFQQQRFAEEGYTPFDPTLAWLEQNAPAGRRVGLAGIWDVNGVSPVFPSFGPRLRNDVVYVGPWIEELLREYDRRRPFVEALRRGGYDLLLVGRGQPPRPSVAEERWAMSAGYRRVAESPRLALYAAPAQAAQKRGGSLQANLPASA